jgi:gag-polyprotein putative aspartyl protease
VVINGNKLAACGDSGASRTTLSKAMASKAGLEHRIKRGKMTTASSDYVVNIIGTTNIDLDIKTLKHGVVHIKRVPVYIVDENMSEVLLGDDLLKCLGIDVHKLIQECGGKIFDYQDGEINQYPHFGGDDEEKITKILKEKVDDIELEDTNKDKWLNLLLEHKNEFRTVMAHDPPVKLPEMQVHFDKEKTTRLKPVRIPYTLQQENFWITMLKN